MIVPGTVRLQQALSALLLFGLLRGLPARSQDDAALKARQALQQGRYAQAEAIYRELIRSGQPTVQLFTNLGISLSLQGKTSDASEAFQHGLALHYDAKTYVLLAKARCDQGDFPSTRAMFPQILKEDAARPELLTIIAPCMLDGGDPIDAVKVYSILASDAHLANDLMLVQLTRAYLASAQFFFGKLHSAQGNEPYVQALQAARSGKAEDARGAFAFAAERSHLFHSEANYTAAVETWKTAPNDVALLYQMSVLSGEESMKSFARCRSVYPASPYSDQLFAEMLADQGRGDEAIAQYQRLLKTNPDLPRLHQELSALYVQAQDWPAALQISQEQIRQHPEDRAAAARISQSLVAMGRYEEAKAFLLPRADRPRPPLWLRLDLATALQQLGDDVGAIAQLVAAEREFPHERSVHYRLIRLYAQAGNMEASARETKLFQASQ